MAVRTKELGASAFTGSAPVTLYTCPAGATAIVKDIALFATTAITAYVQVVRGSLSARVLSGAVTAGGSLVSSGRFIVLEPGDVLQVHSTSSGITATAWVSGSQLDGVA